MADTVMVDNSPVNEANQQPMMKVKKSLKRKRASLIPETLSTEERETKVEELREELRSLFHYFIEILDQKGHLQEMGNVSSGNSLFACLLEESSLPFSKLVDEIYEKLKTKEGITLASVRSSVLFVGQRSMYGIANADADVLEDDSDSCLWCWETRDLKLLPKNQRAVLNIRRVCRKKIHERIAVVSAMIAALQMPPSHPTYRTDLVKASDKLLKVLNEADIRLLAETMVQKSGTDMAEKETKIKEKELMKELERNKREAEKEKKRIDRENQKDRLQNEKEQKRLQDEAEKEARRREKEEAETKKHLKRQQEESEKEQRRREKEAADMKKQLAIQKQATIMERFLKSKKKNSNTQDDVSSTKSSSSKENYEHSPNAVTLSMDVALSSKDGIDTSDLWKSHVDVWSRLGRCSWSGKSKHWGIRQKPKTAVIKELKLQGSSSEATEQSAKVVTSNKGLIHHEELNIEKLVDEWEQTIPNDKSCRDNVADIHICNRIRKLLQFDKSNRPAYYGTLTNKSNVVGPRNPFKKDPNLDYEVESDEEWEEEEPGESLSDCDKDEDEDISEGNLKTEDEDESEDGFLVPDGYLSENEGIHVDSMDVDCSDDEARTSASCKEDIENDEFRLLFRQQKYINNLIEHALRKNQPLIITNLTNEKATLFTAEGLNGTPKIEQMFLQSLSIRAFPSSSPIEISTHDSAQEDFQSHSKSSATPLAHVSVFEEKDLPEIVLSIQEGSQGISKIIESLQRKFPNVSKYQLRNKVREIAEFVDNRWKVKKEIMDKHGLSISPEKFRGRSKSITTFFSKRCLPPGAETLKSENTSPQPCRKRESLSGSGCPENLS